MSASKTRSVEEVACFDTRTDAVGVAGTAYWSTSFQSIPCQSDRIAVQSTELASVTFSVTLLIADGSLKISSPLPEVMVAFTVAPIVAGSPRCSMIATGVGSTSRIVTSSVVKVFCMSLLLALSRGPKAASHGSQSGDFRNDDGDCPNRCRKARAKASGAS